jgi:hypothetical protein
MAYFKKLAERYLDKKKLVTDLIRALILFIFGLVWKYSDQIFIFLGRIFGDWIVPAFSFKICLPLSLLVLLVLFFLLIPSIVNKYFIKTTTKIIKEWIISTNKFTPQWTTLKEIDLNNGKLKLIKLRLKVRSPYLRFGFKLLDANAQVMGANSVLNNDNSILIHIGKQSNMNVIGFVAFRNGVKDLTDQVISEFNETKEIELQIKFINENNIQFYVNKKIVYSSYILETLRSRLYLMAWGDGNEYNLIAENIKIVTEKR